MKPIHIDLTEGRARTVADVVLTLGLALMLLCSCAASATENEADAHECLARLVDLGQDRATGDTLNDAKARVRTMSEMDRQAFERATETVVSMMYVTATLFVEQLRLDERKRNWTEFIQTCEQLEHTQHQALGLMERLNHKYPNAL